MDFSFEQEINLKNGTIITVFCSGNINGGSKSYLYRDIDGEQYDCGENPDVCFDEFYGEEYNYAGEICKVYSKGEILNNTDYDFEERAVEDIYND